MTKGVDTHPKLGIQCAQYLYFHFRSHHQNGRCSGNPQVPTMVTNEKNVYVTGTVSMLLLMIESIVRENNK